jgi:hypothetical protein
MVNESDLRAASRSPNFDRLGLRGLILMLIIGVSVSACGKVVLGPVDHECHVDPARSQGSGCEDYHD